MKRAYESDTTCYNEDAYSLELLDLIVRTGEPKHSVYL